jgi:hypothetical protein
MPSSADQRPGSAEQRPGSAEQRRAAPSSAEQHTNTRTGSYGRLVVRFVQFATTLILGHRFPTIAQVETRHVPERESS